MSAWVAILGAALAAVLCSSSAAGATDNLVLPGLERPVEVLTDELGVPHIYAKNSHDATFMVGYVHARDRFFQMDVNRRSASGTLAELTGSFDDLNRDVGARLMGFRLAGQRSIDLLTPTERSRVQAYVDGINAWLASNPLPPEYGQLEVTSVSAWDLLDSFTMAQAGQRGKLALHQIDETAALGAYVGALGPAAGARLYFEDLGRFAPWLPGATVPDASGPAPSPAAALRDDQPGPASDEFLSRSTAAARRFKEWATRTRILRRELESADPPSGSNAWGVAASKSATGGPLVVGDNHEELTAPSLEYEIHYVVENDPVDGPQNVTGLGNPGISVVFHGHNGRVAWVFTAFGPDISDIFLDRIIRDDPACAARLCIRSAGALHPVEERFESYRMNRVGDGVLNNSIDVTPTVAVLAPGSVHLLSVPFRSFGPILNVEDPSVVQGGAATETTVLTLQYAGFHGARYTWLFDMLRARNVFEFRNALRSNKGFHGNIVVADVDGNLAYLATGEVPLRADLEAGAVVGSPPFLIRDGSGPNNWIEDRAHSQGQVLPFRVIPLGEMPHIVNPPAGFVVNCNEDPSGFVLDNNLLNQFRPSKPSAIHYLGDTGTPGLRNRRATEFLRQLIARHGKVALEDMKHMQGDTHARDAELYIPYVLAAFESALRAGAPPELAELAGDPRLAEAIERFATWDFSTPTGIPEGYDASDVDGVLDPQVSDEEAASSVAATIFNAFRAQLQIRFDTPLRARGIPPRRDESAILFLLSQDPFTGVGASGVDFFPEPAGLSAGDRRDVLLLSALRGALDRLASPAFAAAFGGSAEQDDYRWGKLNRSVIPHALGGASSIPPAAGLVDYAPGLPGIPRDGSRETINAAPAWFLNGANSIVGSFGPENRFAMSPLRPPSGGRGIVGFVSLAGGSSGDPASPLYASQLRTFLTADHHEMLTSRGEIIRGAQTRELFVPRP